MRDWRVHRQSRGPGPKNNRGKPAKRSPTFTRVAAAIWGRRWNSGGEWRRSGGQSVPSAKQTGSRTAQGTLSANPSSLSGKQSTLYAVQTSLRAIQGTLRTIRISLREKQGRLNGAQGSLRPERSGSFANPGTSHARKCQPLTCGGCASR